LELLEILGLIKMNFVNNIDNMKNFVLIYLIDQVNHGQNLLFIKVMIKREIMKHKKINQKRRKELIVKVVLD
jgi:hypothetical protein